MTNDVDEDDKLSVLTSNIVKYNPLPENDYTQDHPVYKFTLLYTGQSCIWHQPSSFCLCFKGLKCMVCSPEKHSLLLKVRVDERLWVQTSFLYCPIGCIKANKQTFDLGWNTKNKLRKESFCLLYFCTF